MVRDKEFEARMQGMIYAANLVKEQGIEALESDIAKRGVYKIPLNMSEKQFNEFVGMLGEGSKNAVFAIVYVVLCEDFGFGEKRLNKFAEGFLKRFQDVFKMDYMGEHYVTLTDYAVMMKEKYGSLEMDIDRIQLEQDGNDKRNPDFRNYIWIDGIIKVLNSNGYSDAAMFLQNKKVDG